MTQTIVRQDADVPVIRKAGRPFGPLRLFVDQETEIADIAKTQGVNQTDVVRDLLDFALKAMKREK